MATRGFSVLEYVVPTFHSGASALEYVPAPKNFGFSVLEAVGPVPDPPTITSVGTHADRLTVAFTPGSDHGYAITSFTVTASPGGVTATGSASPIDIFLAPGVYTVTVHATNTYGDSAESAPASGTVAIPPVPTTPSPDAWASVYENVGVMGLAVPDALGETYQAVNTDQPYPHIWYVFPDQAFLGDTVVVVGTGFGDDQTTYTAELLFGAQQPVVLSWAGLAAGVNAYTVDRQINPADDTADPAHQRIQFVVPTNALSANVRVATETV